MCNYLVCNHTIAVRLVYNTKFITFLHKILCQNFVSLYDLSELTTVVETTTNEARFGTLEDGRLYKILALVFGSLFIVSLFIIVFLMFYKSRRGTTKTTESKRKSFADRTNSTNIISDKPISYMVSS